MKSPSIISASLDVVAETGIDITPIFFDRFFSDHPDQRDAFNRPQTTQGAMINEIIDFIIALEADDDWITDAINSTVAKHHSYGDISPVDFENVLRTLVETLSTVADQRWTFDFSQAWFTQISRLMKIIRTI